NLLLGKVDVEENVEREREFRDAIDEVSVDEEPSYDEIVDLATDVSARINMVLKTAEILGQVLKNYYGSIERSKKQELLQEVFDGPLRMLRFIFEDVIADPDSFAGELQRLIEKNRPLSADSPTTKTVRKFAFNLIGAVCAGVIAKTGNLVNAEKLMEDVDLVASNPDSISYRLISAAIKLTKPGKVPISEIRALSKDLRGNDFGFRMLQSFGYYYLRMFYVETSSRQKLCAALDIEQGADVLVEDRKSILARQRLAAIESWKNNPKN
ncbi:MAG: hypothetical protein AAF384_03780, partial [Pseudomonadota bacterium]